MLQFIIQLKSIYNKNLGFIEQKINFWTLQRCSNKKKSSKLHSFCHDNFFSNDFFRAALYRLRLALHKNALFYFVRGSLNSIPVCLCVEKADHQLLLAWPPPFPPVGSGWLASASYFERLRPPLLHPVVGPGSDIPDHPGFHRRPDGQGPLRRQGPE